MVSIGLSNYSGGNERGTIDVRMASLSYEAEKREHITMSLFIQFVLREYILD
jgi:hypothetical protein